MKSMEANETNVPYIISMIPAYHLVFPVYYYDSVD